MAVNDREPEEDARGERATCSCEEEGACICISTGEGGSGGFKCMRGETCVARFQFGEMSSTYTYEINIP